MFGYGGVFGVGGSNGAISSRTKFNTCVGENRLRKAFSVDTSHTAPIPALIRNLRVLAFDLRAPGVASINEKQHYLTVLT